jgi:hypothetical protein
MYTFSKIQKAFGPRLIGNKFMKRTVSETLSIFPNEIIYFVTRNCWIIGSFEDGWAFTLKAGDLKKNEFLIFLSDELLSQNTRQIRYTISHEIGHIILGHRNAIGKTQSKSEVRRQEKEADAFAKHFLEKKFTN